MPIPPSARAHPRGLDREELQDRIRGHRPAEAGFRRGAPLGGDPPAPDSAYRPFEPEPEDELVLPGAEGQAAGPERKDNTPPGFDDAPVVTPPPPAREPQPVPWRPAPAAPPPSSPPAPSAPASSATQPAPEAPRWTAPREPYLEPGDTYDDYGNGYPEPRRYRGRRRGADRDWDERSGVGPAAIVGFVLLGVLAIGVGAFISGVFSGGVAVASPSPSPSPLVTQAPTATPLPSLETSVAPSAPASSTPGAGTPVPFPDNFSAAAQPCAEEPSSGDGCGSSGATLSTGTMWVWVGFKKGNHDDLLTIEVVNESGTTVGDGSLALASIGCGDSCSGWARFKFNGLAPGNYTIRVARNDEPAAEATFTVTT